MKKKGNSVQIGITPYLKSDWSINKETYSADSQSKASSPLNKYAQSQDEGKVFLSFISLCNNA